MAGPTTHGLLGLGLLGFGPGGWGAALLLAALTTLLLAAASFGIGAALGGAAAFARLAGGLPLRVLADAYGTVFRGVPDLLTVYLLYFGGSAALTAIGHWFGATGFLGVPAFATGALAIGIISGAYQAEVFRAAFLAIDRGELDAARAFAMPRPLMARRIVLPQILRHALPGLGNVWQLILKESALVSVTGLPELMREAVIGAGSTRAPFVFYIAAAVLYLAITTASGRVLRQAEQRSLRGVRLI